MSRPGPMAVVIDLGDGCSPATVICYAEYAERRMSRGSSLTVWVDRLSIEAAEMPVPVVGAHTSMWLDFVDATGKWTSVAVDPVTVRARLDVHPGPIESGGYGGDEYWLWTGDLIGERWRATWLHRSPITDDHLRPPRTSSAEVTLSGIFQPSSGLRYVPGTDWRVHGQVTRVQLMTRRYHRPNGRRWEPIVDERVICRDVDAAPRWFDRGALDDAVDRDTPDITRADIGVLVDLVPEVGSEDLT
jgi:hypothetical protein